jgi:uncharacterized membrane protein YbhN (UPF0104 family)
MRAWGIAWSRIANRSAVIFLLTSAVNAVTLALAGILLAVGLGTGGLPVHYGILPAVAAIAAIGAFVALPRLASRPKTKHRRGKISQALAETGTWVRDTEKAAFTPNWRLLGALAYLLADIAVLWACLEAVGVSAPIIPLVIGYQIGYIANILPIPGGVGVLEGGLLGALLLYGLPAAPTAAAVVLYHAIALWIPTIGGTAGFIRLRRTVAAGEVSVEVPAEYRAKSAQHDGPDDDGPAPDDERQTRWPVPVAPAAPVPRNLAA